MCNARHIISCVILASATLAILAAFGGARAEELTGIPRILDGDTVQIGSDKVRLEGIDAPELSQFCLDDKSQIAECGRGVRDALIQKSAGRSWTCRVSGQDIYRRSLATCSVGGEDIQKWMVRSGYALAFKRYSHAYDADEVAAREGRAGLWSGAFVAPWDWRHRNNSTEILGAVSVPIGAQKVLLRPDANAAPLPATSSAPPMTHPTITSTHRGGCGSRGGPGYRLANGKCASWRQHH